MTALLEFYPPLLDLRQKLKGIPQVFLVGGALRNFYLGTRGTDLDFAVQGDAITLSRRLARVIKGAFVLLDDKHGSARVVKRIDGVPWTFDFTDWRGKTIKEDLGARDFTINAMALDVQNLEITQILEVKASRRDIKAGVVRMVSPHVFMEDPLRLLRAFSLHATLGFKIETKTRARIKKDAHLIADVSAERIREEIFKILTSPRAAATFKAMDKIGLLPQVMPQVTVMVGVHQGGFHHLNVWRHSLEVMSQLEKIIDTNADERIASYLKETIGSAHSRASLLKMGALLHDIGKPETKKKEGKRMTFHGHEHVGAHITRLVARQLKVSVKERHFLEDMVRMHLRPGYLSNFKRPSEKAIFRFMREAKDESVALCLLALADQAATRGPLTTQAKSRHHAKICHMLIERYFAIKDQKPQVRLLTGHDLIKVLKLKPSPVFTKILEAVQEATALGQVKTKEEALSLVRKLI